MRDTLRTLRRRLQAIVGSQGQPLYDEREARAIADLLLDEVCGITLTERLLHPGRTLTDDERRSLQSVVARMEQGVPVQQALGYAWFCGARFRVSPDVLIPRPETAELVEWVIGDIRSASAAPAPVGASPSRSLSVCDVGTGSGCIAVTLARAFPQARVLALDVSGAALNIARQNASLQHVDNLQFAQVDVLAYVDNLQHEAPGTPVSDVFPQGYQHFDILVSNPPYVCRREASEMSDIVLRHEPALALFVPDSDPLRFYRAIARMGLRHLHDGGCLYFEINAAFGADTCRLLQSLGYHDVELRTDVTGRDRMVKAKLSTSEKT